jgi:hypothetical protein
MLLWLDMSMVISVANDNNVFKITPTGLMIEGQPSQDEWYNFRHCLMNMPESVHWIIGDWLNYGIDHYNLTYTEVADLLKENGLLFCKQTLRNDKYVAAKIHISWRHDGLSWQHHKEVASLPGSQQEYWLSYASKMHISTKELRSTIKGVSVKKWLRTSDVWEFKTFDEKYGEATPSRLPAQVIQNLLFYYTKPDAFVIDPLSVDCTTMDVCTKFNPLKRKCLAFDITPLRDTVLQADATKPWPSHQPADFIFINAIRPSIARFTQEYGITVRKILGEAAFNLNNNGVLSIILEPRTNHEQDRDWSFEVFHWMKDELNLKYERRVILPIPSYCVYSKQKAEAKKHHDMFSRILELVIFRKRSIKKCARCGIMMFEASTNGGSDNLKGKSLCPKCMLALHSMNKSEKDNIMAE